VASSANTCVVAPAASGNAIEVWSGKMHTENSSAAGQPARHCVAKCLDVACDEIPPLWCAPDL